MKDLTNHFGCNLEIANETTGVNSLQQGIASIIFAISYMPFLIYFFYIFIKALKLRKTKENLVLIALMSQIIASMISRILIFLDDSVYCASKFVYYIFQTFPVILVASIIYWFDYFILFAIYKGSGENKNEKEELEKEIEFIIRFKFPLLVIYIILYIIGFLVLDLFLNNYLLFEIYECFSVLYCLFYTYFLILNMNIIKRILSSRNSEAKNLINKEIFAITFIIIINCIYRLTVFTLDNLIPFIFRVYSWVDSFKANCFKNGSLWFLILNFITTIVEEIDIFFVFSLLVTEFIFYQNYGDIELPKIFIEEVHTNEYGGRQSLIEADLSDLNL